MSAIEKINSLNQEQRDAALHHARMRIAGTQPQVAREPQMADYERNTYSQLPPTVVTAINRMSELVIVCAFVPSALRIFAATYLMSVTHFDVGFALVVGATSIFLAEIGQVVFMLARTTATEGKWQLAIGAFICTLYALIGNAQVAQPWSHGGLFAWLETFAPPVLVLLASQVRKTQILHSIADRYAARTQYEGDHAEWKSTHEQTMREWQQRYDNAHQHEDWMRVYANALRDALRHINRKSTAVLREVTDDDWLTLILREVRAEQWYVQAEVRAFEKARSEEARLRLETQTGPDPEDEVPPEEPRTTPLRTGKVAGTHTGELGGAMIENTNGTHTATCPHCLRKFTKDKERDAMNALVAHSRHCKVRKSAMEEETQPTTPVREETE
jgi:hypothetical protein